MAFFRSRARRELDSLIEEIEINLANNYKDVAHDARRRLGRRVEELYADGKLKEKHYRAYRARFETYTQIMRDYHH